jgi:hypothetical protein
MGRVLPVPEYPAHPPPYETYAHHVKETYDRGVRDVHEMKSLLLDKKTQPIAVAV